MKQMLELELMKLRQHPLFPVLDYIAKHSYRQSQVLEELKTEVQSIKKNQKDLQTSIEKLQDKGSLNIDQFKVKIR